MSTYTVFGRQSKASSFTCPTVVPWNRPIDAHVFLLPVKPSGYKPYTNKRSRYSRPKILYFQDKDMKQKLKHFSPFVTILYTARVSAEQVCANVTGVITVEIVQPLSDNLVDRPLRHSTLTSSHTFTKHFGAAFQEKLFPKPFHTST